MAANGAEQLSVDTCRPPGPGLENSNTNTPIPQKGLLRATLPQPPPPSQTIAGCAPLRRKPSAEIHAPRGGALRRHGSNNLGLPTAAWFTRARPCEDDCNASNPALPPTSQSWPLLPGGTRGLREIVANATLGSRKRPARPDLAPPGRLLDLTPGKSSATAVKRAKQRALP
eukprot:11216851-Lingulodinium_polyedra.AAC.2